MTRPIVRARRGRVEAIVRDHRKGALLIFIDGSVRWVNTKAEAEWEVRRSEERTRIGLPPVAFWLSLVDVHRHAKLLEKPAVDVALEQYANILALLRKMRKATLTAAKVSS